MNCLIIFEWPMIIHVKNKNTLIIDDFKLTCCIGKNGMSSNKREGDYSTPKGLFKLKTFKTQKVWPKLEKIGKYSENSKFDMSWKFTRWPLNLLLMS